LLDRVGDIATDIDRADKFIPGQSRRCGTGASSKPTTEAMGGLRG
jgi:hypothetical protein